MDFKRSLQLSLQYHNTLNPVVFDLGTDNAEPSMIPEIRAALLKIARAWQEYCDIPSYAVKDIIFTGGNANFNYTEQSDMDVHIVIEPKLMSSDEKLLLDNLFAKKALWADAHPNIKVKGYTVELFAQPISEKPHQDQGVYSLVLDAWLDAPENKHIDFSSDPYLIKKINWFKQRIDNIINTKSKDELSIVLLKERIRNMRAAAIQRGGEFSFENLVFKELRNSGYLDKLSKYKSNLEDEQLSFEKVETANEYK